MIEKIIFAHLTFENNNIPPSQRLPLYTPCLHPPPHHLYINYTCTYRLHLIAHSHTSSPYTIHPHNPHIPAPYSLQYHPLPTTHTRSPPANHSPNYPTDHIHAPHEQRTEAQIRARQGEKEGSSEQAFP